MRYALTIAVVLLTGLVGCKQSSERPEDRPTSPQPQQVPEATAPQARTTTTPGTRSEPRPQTRPESPMAASVVDVAKVKWLDGPPGLPKGAKFAVLEGAPPFPANSTFTVLAKLPPNYTVPPHTHLVTEHVTVLKGTVSLGHGEKLDRATATKVKTGGVIFTPAGHAHYAFTTDTGATVALSGVGPWEILYINPKDDPRPAPATRPSDFVASTWDAPMDAKIFQPSDVAYSDPPAGMLPPGIKMAVLEGDPSQAKTFTIRLLLQKGQQMPVHAHSYSERFILLAGKVEFAFGETFAKDQLKPVNLPSVGLVPANQMHYARALADNTIVQISGVGPFDMKLGKNSVSP